MTVIKNLSTKIILVIGILIVSIPVFASGVGYIDYDKVVSEYQFAKVTAKEIETKANEIQEYLESKEKEFAELESPIQRQKLEAAVKSEMRAKEDAFNDFKNKSEDAVYSRIHAVSEKIRLEKGLDAILDKRSVFSGGTDITDELINKLNAVIR